MDNKLEILDVHIPCATCGKLIPAGGNNKCLTCRLMDVAMDHALQTWIPVTDRLPTTLPRGYGKEYSEALNVLTSGRKVLTAVYDGTEFICDFEFWGAEGEEITHWTQVLLPLPEPPKGE